MVSQYQNALCKVLSLFAPAANKISTKTKNNILRVIFLLFSLCSIFYNCVPASIHIFIKYIIGAVFLCAAIFFSIDGPIKKVAWDKRVAGLWIIYSLLCMVSGIIVSKEFLPMACIMLILFPAFFLVWNNRKDYKTLGTLLFDGVVYPSVILIIISLCLLPIPSNGFSGLTHNPNTLSQYIYLAAPFLIARYDQNIKSGKKICNWQLALIALLFVTTLYTSCRTASLIFTFLIIAWFVYRCFIIKADKKSLLILYGKLAAMILVLFFVVILLNSLLVPVFQYQKWGGKVQSFIVSQINGVESNVSVYDADTAEVYDIINGYIIRVEGADKHKSSLNDYSSGRIGIWQEVLRRTNFFGHPSKEHIYTERNGDVGVNAHNNFLQVLYDNGIFAAIAFLLLFITIAWKAFFVIDKRSELAEGFMYLCMVFFLASCLEIVSMPFIYLITLIFFLCSTMAFEDNGKSYKPDLSDFKTNFKNK